MPNGTDVRGLSKSAVWDYENGFYWFSAKGRLNKMLAHYELYKQIVSLPGDIYELGVYKAASFIRLATYRDALENDSSRRIIGFDAFGEFPTERLEMKEDIEFVENFENTGSHGLAREEVEALLTAKGFSNFDLVKGNIFDTLPRYLDEHPEARIALLHLDMDVKEPTDFALETLYDRVVPGGLIILDDYNAVAGATLSVDAFCREHRLAVEKLPFYSAPAFVRKPVG